MRVQYIALLLALLDSTQSCCSVVSQIEQLFLLYHQTKTVHLDSPRRRRECVDDHRRQGGDGTCHRYVHLHTHVQRLQPSKHHVLRSNLTVNDVSARTIYRQEVQSDRPAPPRAGAHRESLGRSLAPASAELAHLCVPAQAKGGEEGCRRAACQRCVHVCCSVHAEHAACPVVVRTIFRACSNICFFKCTQFLISQRAPGTAS